MTESNPISRRNMLKVMGASAVVTSVAGGFALNRFGEPLKANLLRVEELLCSMDPLPSLQDILQNPNTFNSAMLRTQYQISGVRLSYHMLMGWANSARCLGAPITNQILSDSMDSPLLTQSFQNGTLSWKKEGGYGISLNNPSLQFEHDSFQGSEITSPVKVPIYLFHGIDNSKDPYARSPEYFEGVINGLVDKGVTFITHLDLYQVMCGMKPLIPNSAIIRIDDGLQSDMTVKTIIDKLRRIHNIDIPVDIFVPAVMLDRPGFLTSQDLRQLALDHFSIGSHGWDTKMLTEVADPTQWIDQCKKSKIMLENITNRPCSVVAYPGGRYSHEVIQAMQTMGFLIGSATAGPSSQDEVLAHFPSEIMRVQAIQA